MWTRKAALMLTSEISLILVGMMISNFQLMIAGLTYIRSEEHTSELPSQ